MSITELQKLHKAYMSYSDLKCNKAEENHEKAQPD